MIASDSGIGEHQMVPWERIFWAKFTIPKLPYFLDFGRWWPTPSLHSLEPSWSEWVFSFIDSLFPLSLFDCSQVTVGEAENPRKNIPIAIRRTFWRILIFYIGGVFVIGLIVPSTNQSLFTATKSKTGAAASPFVVATTLVCPIVPLYVLAAQLNLSGWH